MNRRNQTLYGGMTLLCAVVVFGLPLLFKIDAVPVVTYIQIMTCGLLLARIADKIGA